MTVRVASMVGPPPRPPPRNELLEGTLAQTAMAVDVLHHNDGVIHQNADGEDQRKQRHPVEGKAPGPAGKQGQRQGDDDGNPTTSASRQPMLTSTSSTTAVVAKISLPIRVLDLVSAVTP